MRDMNVTVKLSGPRVQGYGSTRKRMLWRWPSLVGNMEGDTLTIPRDELVRLCKFMSTSLRELDRRDAKILLAQLTNT